MKFCFKLGCSEKNASPVFYEILEKRVSQRQSKMFVSQPRFCMKFCLKPLYLVTY
jgi:hypothetical protein